MRPSPLLLAASAPPAVLPPMPSPRCVLLCWPSSRRAAVPRPLSGLASPRVSPRALWQRSSPRPPARPARSCLRAALPTLIHRVPPALQLLPWASP
eukprot:8134792-Lingulodinium_polyedra.AAC.1